MTPQDPNFPEDILPVPPPRPGQSPDSNSDSVSDQNFDQTSDATAGQLDGPDRLDGFAGPDESVGITSDPAIAAAPPSAQPAPGVSPEDDRRPLDALPTEPSLATPDLADDAASVADRPTAQTYRNPRAVPPLGDVWADADVPYQPKELGVVDQILLWLADGVTLWKRCLRWVRSQLPPNLQLSDGLLTAIALGLLILCLALWSPLGAGRGSRAVATHDPLPQAGAEEPSVETEAPAPQPNPELAEPPSLEEAQPLVPSPEQRLIADIQERVSAISRSYGAGLIQSVEVNVPANTLGVNLAEAWYGLLTSQQNEIAQDIYQQAQGLNFSTLQLRDPDGVVVARNPVVGNTMVVLRRLRSAEAS
jgi:hypothetical protein